MNEELREREAIESCRLGRIEGLETLYVLYSNKVFRTCVRMLGSEAAAEDQMQEVFLHVFKQIPKFRGNSRFSTWLYRLTVNSTLNAIRKAKRDQNRDERAGLDRALHVEPGARRIVGDDWVEMMLARLSPEHRAVVVLREIEELSYAEIAEVLEVPLGTVMSRLSRARKTLIACANEEAEDRNQLMVRGVERNAEGAS